MTTKAVLGTPEIKVYSGTRSLRESFQSFLHYRELLLTWTVREIKGRYRQSALGFGWALIQPIVQILVISIIFGRFVRVPSEGVPYPVFSFVAILPWSFFASSITASIPSLLSNMDLITKIYFPREFIPLSSIVARFVDFCIASIVLVGLLIFYSIPMKATLLYVPLILIIQIMLTIAIGLLGSAISVFLRDISFAIPLAMQVWMYASPVIYPMSLVPEKWRLLYAINPMVGIIDSYRRVVLNGEPPDPLYLGISAAFAVVLCVISYIYFKRLELFMADII
jgi:lipopolysaccharide transport system permease protein